MIFSYSGKVGRILRACQLLVKLTIYPRAGTRIDDEGG
jgi:hypothetical protein